MERLYSVRMGERQRGLVVAFIETLVAEVEVEIEALGVDERRYGTLPEYLEWVSACRTRLSSPAPDGRIFLTGVDLATLRRHLVTDLLKLQLARFSALVQETDDKEKLLDAHEDVSQTTRLVDHLWDCARRADFEEGYEGDA